MKDHSDDAEYVKQYRRLIKGLIPNLIAAKIPANKIQMLQVAADKGIVAEIEPIIKKLDPILAKDGAYQGFMSIYGLKPPEWWNNMSMLGLTDLREHKLLKIQSQNLRKAWSVFNGKVKKQEEAHAKSDATKGNTA